jgi:hypothetical protein
MKTKRAIEKSLTKKLGVWNMVRTILLHAPEMEWLTHRMY